MKLKCRILGISSSSCCLPVVYGRKLRTTVHNWWQLYICFFSNTFRLYKPKLLYSFIFRYNTPTSAQQTRICLCHLYFEIMLQNHPTTLPSNREIFLSTQPPGGSISQDSDMVSFSIPLHNTPSTARMSLFHNKSRL